MNRQRQHQKTDEEWEPHKEIIRHLYLDEGRPLEGSESIVEILKRDHNFSATLKKWGFRKYTTTDQWRALDQVLTEREAVGKKSLVSYRGQLLKPSKIRKERTRHRAKESSATRCRLLPPCFRVETPPLSDEPIPEGEGNNGTHSPPGLETDGIGTLEELGMVMSRRTTPPISSVISGLVAMDHPPRAHIFNSGVFSQTFSSVQHFPMGNAFPNNPSFLFQSGDSFHSMSPQYRLGSPSISFVGESPGTLSLLKTCDPNIFLLMRQLMQQSDISIDETDLRQEALCAPHTNKFLCTQNFDARLVYWTIHCLNNNHISLDQLREPESALELLYRRVIDQLNSLSSDHLNHFIGSIQPPFTQAVEHSLFRAAIELGVLCTVQVILKRGIRTEEMKLHANNQTYNPLERAAHLGFPNIIECLLQNGMGFDSCRTIDPLECFSVTQCPGTLPDSVIRTLQLLLQVGAKFNKNAIRSFLHVRDPRVVETLLRNLESFDESTLLDSKLLLDITLDGDTSTIDWAIESFLNRDWTDVVRKGELFVATLTACLGNIICREHTDHVEHLLNAGAVPNSFFLSKAIGGENMNAIELLLAMGVNTNEKISSKERVSLSTFQYRQNTSLPHLSPIATAVYANLIPAIQCFRAKGYFDKARVSGDDDLIYDIVCSACASGNKEILKEFLPLLRRSEQFSQEKYFGSSRSSAINEAVRSGHLAIIMLLLEAGHYPRSSTLSFALSQQNIELVHIILDTLPGISPQILAKESLSSSKERKRTAFENVLDWGNAQIIKDLSAAGVSWNGTKRMSLEGLDDFQDLSCSYLSASILEHKHQLVDLLIELHAPIDKHGIQDSRMYPLITPLCAALLVGNHELFNAILDIGADPADNGALWFVSLSSNIDLALQLTKAISKRYPHGMKGFGVAALREAILKGDLVMLEVLLTVVDTNAHDIGEFSRSQYIKEHKWDLKGLGYAIESKNENSIDMIKLCLRSGADPNGIVATQRPWRTGQLYSRLTALMLAIGTTQLDKVTVIIEGGAKVDYPARNGVLRTPLQYAAEVGAMNIIVYLLQLGASPNEPPALRSGGTALQLAAREGSIGIAFLLLSVGAEINAPAGLMYGRTAIEGATENGRIDMILFLVDHGADLLANDSAQYKRAVKFAEESGQIPARDLVIKLHAAALKNAEYQKSITGTMNEGLIANSSRAYPAPSTSAYP